MSPCESGTVPYPSLGAHASQMLSGDAECAVGFRHVKGVITLNQNLEGLGSWGSWLLPVVGWEQKETQCFLSAIE